MWPFRRKTADDDESSYESYSSYEEYTDEEFEEEENEHVKEGETEAADNVQIANDAVVEEDKAEEKAAMEEPVHNAAAPELTDVAVTEEPTKEPPAPDEEIVTEEPANEGPVEAAPEVAVPSEVVTNEAVPEQTAVEEPVQDNAVDDDVADEEQSLQSSEEEKDSDNEDLVLVKSHEEEETSKGEVGVSYDTEDGEELELMDVEDSFDTHEQSYDTGGESEVEEESSDEEEEEEEPSSLSEKQSLLALAAEHDRVDILKAILAENASEQAQLLNSPIPPLHVAVSYGSTHATSCLLRMGANPAIRPNVAEIRKTGNEGDVHNLARYDGVSAWELAFGRTASLENDDAADDDAVKDDEEAEEPQETKKSWFGVFGGSSRSSSQRSLDDKAEKEETPPGPPASSPRRSSVKPVDMAPSKREGIRHAFTAEALRCIGADEAERLQQLLDSGMPSDIDVGGKTLHGWCLEMGSLHCEPLIRPAQVEKEEEEGASEDEQENSQAVEETPESPSKGKEQETETPVATSDSKPTDLVTAGDKESLASLANRHEELEALATALATVLDNLAEEVSVCHGLLLSGGGAAALASHVRSLKALREQREGELEHWTREWENGEDELAYWAREYGSKYHDDFPATSLTTISRRNSFREPQNAEEEESQRRQLLAQLGASENKIRKLRASITDLSEENTRDLEEVERRSLTGGVRLVRTLRDELREVEFKLSEAKSGEAACRARVSLIQSRLDARKKKEKKEAKNATHETKQAPNESSGETEVKPDSRMEEEPESSQTSRELPSENPQGKSAPEKGATKLQSDVIATGDSTALTIHQPHGRYLPVQLWDILLRIIGMGKEAVRRSAENIRGSASNVMIV